MNKKDIVGITKRKNYLCAKVKHISKMDTKQDLTLREKVAINSLVFGIIKNWYEAYEIAYNGKADDLQKRKALPTIVTRWKNSDKIKDFYNTSLYMHKQEEERKRAEILKGFQDEGGKEEKGGDNIRTKRTSAKMVDFSNPQNQMQKLNELVNSSEDVGETLDALKVIISTQKADRESAREGKAVKAYLPMACNDCPLYQRRKK